MRLTITISILFLFYSINGEKIKIRKNNIRGKTNNESVINEERWEAYYKCLNDYYNEKHHKTIEVKYFLAFEGQSVNLECSLCMSPETVEIKWFFKKEINSNVVEMKGKKNIEQNNNGTLEFYRVTTKHKGYYFCSIGDSNSDVYLLQIENDYEKLSVKKIEENAKMDVEENITLESQNLIIFTKQSNWTKCSTCNAQGFQRRVQVCYIKLNDWDVNIDESHANKLLRDYPSGIPCMYFLTIKVIDICPETEINKIIISNCNETCEIIFETEEIVQLNNYINESQTNIHKHSFLVPDIRKVSVDENDNVTIKCLGKLRSNRPRKWLIGKTGSKFDYMSVLNNSRINMTYFDDIQIRNVELLDTNIYSCWELERLVEVIHLTVQHNKENYSQTTTMSVILVCVTYLIMIKCTCSLIHIE